MRKDEKETYQAYDEMALEYHDYRTKKHPKGWFYNEYLEMPSVLKTLGNIRGKKILDFGCGSGIYAKILAKRGAIVKGFDISKEMIKIAKKNNPKLDLRIGSGYKIPFDEKFDIVLSALTVHYLEDWDKMLKEVGRVLKEGGYFVFSTDNPVTAFGRTIRIKGKRLMSLGLKSYFDEGKYQFVAEFDNGKKIIIPCYHKTYESIIKNLIRNNFEILDYIDAFPDKRAKKLFPKSYEKFSKIPKFCIWKVRKR